VANYYLIDSCVWIEHFMTNNKKPFLDQEIPLALSTLSFFEIIKKLKNLNFPPKKINHIINYFKEYNLILPTDTTIALEATNFPPKQLSAMDALIYTTANIHNCIFVTQDNDFRGLPNVQFI